MTHAWSLAALWLGLALIATLLSIWLGVATALSEIVVGTVAQLLIGAFVGKALLGTSEPWITFLSGTGAIVLTFLAGAELDPVVLRTRWKETAGIGLVGFFAPFLGCAAFAFYALHWTPHASWLAGVALSTTSVAVVYAVMLEMGLNSTAFGKAVLAACFVNDLGTVIALGLIIAPFTFRTVVFIVVSLLALGVLPWITPRFFRRYGGRPSELEAKFLFLTLFALGALAAWADSEPVLPAYLIGMVLAGTVGKDHALVRRLRTVTFGLLTPFYFIRAGSFVSVPALVSAPCERRGASPRQARGEVDRRLARDAAVPLPAAGGGVHDAPHVDRAHLRQHLRAVRPDSRHRRPDPVLLPDRGRDRQRRRPDADRKCLLPAEVSSAAGDHRRRPLGRGGRGRRAVSSPRGATMIPKRILAAHDGSPDADQAFETAVDFAALCGARLEVVSVATPPEPPTRVETEAALDAATRHYELVFEGLLRRAHARGVDLETRILVGHPAEQILHLASQTQADLVVVGHRGRSTIRQWLFGSTSRRVVAHAPCSVLVVRQQ